MSILGWITKPISKAIVRNVMKDIIEKLWPMIKYLIDRAILIPVLAMGGIGAGVYFKYIDGDIGMYGLIAIAMLVLVSRIFKRKGK